MDSVASDSLSKLVYLLQTVEKALACYEICPFLYNFYRTGPLGAMLKTFFVCNLHILVKSWSVCA
jgi:hypothetical protein